MTKVLLIHACDFFLHLPRLPVRNKDGDTDALQGPSSRYSRRPGKQRCGTIQLCLSLKDGQEIVPPQAAPSRRLPQHRVNTAATRKPRNYWKNIQNIERELRNQWMVALGCDVRSDQSQQYLPVNKPPPIPNYTLLYHWERNDLATVVRNVGILELSYELGGATVVPGKWKEAVKLPLIQHIVELDEELSLNSPPRSPQQRKNKTEVHNFDQGSTTISGTKKRKKRGYWSKKTIIFEV
jgi:hypothetical protein